VASAKKQKANLFCIHDFLILIVREEYVSGVNKKLIYSSPTFFVYSVLYQLKFIFISFFFSLFTFYAKIYRMVFIKSHKFHANIAT
jgi:hypothetical protein